MNPLLSSAPIIPTKIILIIVASQIKPVKISLKITTQICYCRYAYLVKYARIYRHRVNITNILSLKLFHKYVIINTVI